MWGLNKVLMHVREIGSMLEDADYLRISALLVLFSADTHFCSTSSSSLSFYASSVHLSKHRSLFLPLYPSKSCLHIVGNKTYLFEWIQNLKCLTNLGDHRDKCETQSMNEIFPRSSIGCWNNPAWPKFSFKSSFFKLNGMCYRYLNTGN